MLLEIRRSEASEFYCDCTRGFSKVFVQTDFGRRRHCWYPLSDFRVYLFRLERPTHRCRGLAGPQVIHGREARVSTLGLALHYFIAFSAATVYCLASRRLEFLKEHFLVSGLFYGISVFLVMYFVVMPLCAFHYKGPYTLHILREGIIVHMLLIGLPISASLRNL